MKRVPLLRWSGAVLTPRARPVCSQHRLQRIAALPSRCQSTAAAAAATAPSPESPVSQTQSSQPRLINKERAQFAHLPSPPPQSVSTSARLAALHARLSLSPRLPIETLSRCLIDPSADAHPTFNNTSLSILGRDLLGYHSSELILCSYPRLPTVVIFACMNAYCGAGTLASITREWGVEVAAAPGGEVDPGLLQYLPTVAGNADPTGTGVLVKEAEQPPKRQKPWNVGLTSRTVQENYFGELDGRTSLDYAERPELQIQDIRARLANGVTFEQAASNFVQAVFGAVYLHGGRAAAKAFFNAHIASRKLDVSSLFAFRQPTRDLSRLCAREGFESPVARIISETGRKSRTPVFVVGVYSGRDKLGEGSGASLEEARTRAAVNALKGWYLYSPLERKVPSDVEGGGGNWEPVLIDGGEVIV